MGRGDFILLGALGAALAAIVMGQAAHSWPGFFLGVFGQTVAAWVQGVGTILAVFVAIRNNRSDAKERGNRENKIALAGLKAGVPGLQAVSMEARTIQLSLENVRASRTPSNPAGDFSDTEILEFVRMQTSLPDVLLLNSWILAANEREKLNALANDVLQLKALINAPGSIEKAFPPMRLMIRIRQFERISKNANDLAVAVMATKYC